VEVLTATPGTPPGSAIVLGANGRLGRASLEAFAAAGWRVAGFSRSAPGAATGARVRHVAGDALDAEALAREVAGYDVIVNALNVPYSKWPKMLPRLTDAIVGAAARSGATVIIPGNVYHYGEGMPALLSEDTPANPTSDLGRARLAMERTFRARAFDDGFRTLILRAGDFIEGRRTGGWFDTRITAKLGQGKFVYPGPLSVAHAWAYLKDYSRAVVALAAGRERLPSYRAVGFPGHALTGRQLVDALSAATGTRLRTAGIPWAMVKLVSLASPEMRRIVEMSYLWRCPHEIDGTAFQALLPDFVHTPLPDALSEVCAQLGITARIGR
jgi:nucleoside-diphosphate-sugar epimerase